MLSYLRKKSTLIICSCSGKNLANSRGAALTNGQQFLGVEIHTNLPVFFLHFPSSIPKQRSAMILSTVAILSFIVVCNMSSVTIVPFIQIYHFFYFPGLISQQRFAIILSTVAILSFILLYEFCNHCLKASPA